VRTALIATVLNEADGIGEFLASMEGQTRIPDVIVVTDGGSTDGTRDRLRAFSESTSLPFQFAEALGNRSVGRNAAIRTSEADVIAVTDVSVLDPQWFERIVAPLEEGEADVVAGWYEVLTETRKAQAMGLLTQFSPEQIDPETFLPSSRSVAFSRAAWEAVGGYPEAYAKNEDTVFDISLREAGLRFAFVPQAVVRWRPPDSLSEAYRMEVRFAEGDGEAGVHLWSYTRYGLLYGAYIGGIGLLLLGFVVPLIWFFLGILTVGYALFRLRKVLLEGLLSQVPYGFLVVLALDAARLRGYLRGRLRRR
jgi:glycosyltransferase involved in cell wall biosynthesis